MKRQHDDVLVYAEKEQVQSAKNTCVDAERAPADKPADTSLQPPASRAPADKPVDTERAPVASSSLQPPADKPASSSLQSPADHLQPNQPNQTTSSLTKRRHRSWPTLTKHNLRWHDLMIEKGSEVELEISSIGSGTFYLDSMPPTASNSSCYHTSHYGCSDW